MLVRPVGAPATHVRRGRDLQGLSPRVDLGAHGRRGIAAVQLGEESLGMALIGHTDEGLSS